MRKKYDLAASLGGACAVSKSLRMAGMQFASFPFDWLNGATFRDRILLLTGGFGEWLSEGVDKLPEPPCCIGESHWRDRKYGFGLLHDFDRITPVETALPSVKEKYVRRHRRLCEQIGKSASVLLVWTDVPTSPEVTDEDLRFAVSALKEKWPQTRFELLVFRRAPGVPLSAATDETRGEVRMLVFDYMRQEVSKYGVLLADHDLLAEWLRERYEVPDYRTEEEIARWRRISRRNKYRQFGGTGLWTYLVGKFQYKLYKHLLKRLQRKGVL